MTKPKKPVTPNPTSPQIEFRALAAMRRYAGNMKVHTDEQRRSLAALIQSVGWTFPILVDEDEEIIAGHGRDEAAGLIYAEGGTIRMFDGTPVPAGCVPVIVARGWTDDQKRSYRIADNQTAMLTGFDEDLLKAELLALKSAEADLTLTGFDADTLAKMLDVSEAAPPDEFPEFDEDIDTEHKCPKCGYAWSGKAS